MIRMLVKCGIGVCVKKTIERLEAETFFQMFERESLANDQQLLLRVIFLLRIACKEIDESLLKLMGVSKRSESMLSTVFTKPKGMGWLYAIRFLHEHRENINDTNAEIILPLLEDWTNKFQIGAATRFAGLLTLHYYQTWIRNEQLRYRRFRKNKDRLIGIISNSSGEITDELKEIFEQIISKEEIGYQVERVLTKEYEWFKETLKTVSERLNIPYGQRVPGGWTIHDLRHTCLSTLALEGMPLHAIKE